MNSGILQGWICYLTQMGTKIKTREHLAHRRSCYHFLQNTSSFLFRGRGPDFGWNLIGKSNSAFLGRSRVRREGGWGVCVFFWLLWLRGKYFLLQLPWCLNPSITWKFFGLCRRKKAYQEAKRESCFPSAVSLFLFLCSQSSRLLCPLHQFNCKPQSLGVTGSRIRMTHSLVRPGDFLKKTYLLLHLIQGFSSY